MKPAANAPANPPADEYAHANPAVSRWQQLYGFTFTEGEVRLLVTGRSLLDPYDQQRRYLLLTALRAETCPACQYILCPRSAWTGVTLGRDRVRPWPGSPEPVDVSWAGDGADGALFACPACRARLVHQIGLAESDHWMTLAPGQVVTEAGGDREPA